MAAKDPEVEATPEPEAPAAAPAETATLVGATYPTVQVKVNVGVRGLRAGTVGEVPDDDETAALISSGYLEHA